MKLEFLTFSYPVLRTIENDKKIYLFDSKYLFRLLKCAHCTCMHLY